jgi:uncharacterized protein
MSAVFADTYYFLGLLNRADESHARCVTFSREYRGELITTEYVLVEVADALVSPRHRLQAARFIQALENHPRVQIIWATQVLFERGLKLYAERVDKEWSLTDCISFTLMGDRDLRDVLTDDHHFEQAGFTELLK